MNSLLEPGNWAASNFGDGYGCGEGWIWGNGLGNGDNGSDGEGNGDGDIGIDGNGIGDGDSNDGGAPKHPVRLGLITEHHTDVQTSVTLIALRWDRRTARLQR